MGATEVVGALGPCIHPGCYEFSEADLDAVAAASATGSGADDRRPARPSTCPPLSRPPWPSAGPGGGRRGACTACAGGYFSHGPAGTAGARPSSSGRTAGPAPGERPAGGPGGPGFTERLAEVRRRIDSASGRPGSVRIVAVTKGFGADAVIAALSAGLTDIGENYADELVGKAGSVAAEPDRSGGGPTPPAGSRRRCGTSWARCNGTRCPVWPRGWAGGRACPASRRGGPSPDAARGRRCWSRWTWPGSRAGGAARPTRSPELVGVLRHWDLDVAGLMAVGPPGDPEASRPGFALVSGLADRLDLPVRSMGMSDDLEVALAEGSTMVRLGRALFGARPAPAAGARRGGPDAARPAPDPESTSRWTGWSTSAGSQALRCAQEDTMPASFMKKTMAYLGLVDDDYDDFDDYEPRTSSSSVAAPVTRASGQRSVAVADDFDEPTTAIPNPRIRTLTRTRPAGRPWPPGHVSAPGPPSDPRRSGPSPRRLQGPGCTSWPPGASPTPRRSPTGS